MPDSVYKDNDNVILVIGLRDAEGNLLAAADVRLLEIVGVCGAEVSGISFPITLAPTEPGNYQGIIPKEIDAVRGEYVGVVRAEQGGITATFDKKLYIRRREV